MGSSFYKKTNGKINSPYGSKKINDPDREIALYGLKNYLIKFQKISLSVDMNACMKYRMDDTNIKSIKNINILLVKWINLYQKKNR